MTRKLSDGTPIRAQDNVLDDLERLLQEALDDNDQEVLVEIKGYTSKGSQNVANITLNLVYDYHALLEEALEHAEDFSDFDTKLTTQRNWQTARKEVISSLQKSLRKKNPRDNISLAAESIFDILPTVLVGLSSGLVQLRGIVTDYELIEKGKKNKRHSSKITLAKNKILDGTFKGPQKIGSLRTLALEKGRFDTLRIQGTVIRSDAFYSDVEEDSFRVFTGNKGHSERIQLSERGDTTRVKIATEDRAYRVLAQHTVAGKALTVSQIRRKLKVPDAAVAMSELNRAKNITSPTLIGYLGSDGGLAVHQIRGRSTKKQKIGPSSKSKTFIEVKRDNKRISEDQTVIFVQPSSNQIVINLNWTRPDESLDLDLGAFVELNSGLKRVLQPLGELFGALEYPPYVLHSGDDRTGDSEKGEFLFIELDNIHEIKRICVYAMIYSGIANWKEADAVVTIDVPGQPTVSVLMGQHDSRKGHAAICMIDIKDDFINVERLVTFHNSHGFTNSEGVWTTEIDEAYGWGIIWGPGANKD